MENIKQYISKHHQHMTDVFKSLGKDDTLQATKVFIYIQQAFSEEDFAFILRGENYFRKQQNSAGIEKLVEKFYRQNDDDSRKFYLYRILFTFQEVIDLLEFWLKNEPELIVSYQIEQQQQQKKQNKEQEEKQEGLKEQNDQNQFEIDVREIPVILAECQNTKSQYQIILNDENENEEKKKDIKKKLQQLNYKIKTLEQRIKSEQKSQSMKKHESMEILDVRKKKKIKRRSENSESEQAKSVSPRKQVNYLSIFEFYSKQIHLTGAKATFERIQHESQTMNYQKVVHFLREFNLLPEKPGDKKKVHRLYIRSCGNSRNLNFSQFMKFLDGLAEILFTNDDPNIRRQLLKEKILLKRQKDKLLNNPFHILQNEDFRINSKQIKYEFKLKPQFGKFEQQVTDELQNRRKIKQEQKEEKLKERQIRKIKYLKRLQSMDPFHPQVSKNSKLLQRSAVISEPVVNLENIERYRDEKFDFKLLVGADEGKQGVRGLSGKEKNNYRRAELIQKQEAEKMKNLMSGIIKRSDAKLQKLGIPRREVKFM